MKKRNYGRRSALCLVLMLVWLCSMTVFATGASGDNSLSTLGITTEGAVVSPEFLYSTIEYNVTVPAGTARLELEPVTSNPNAWIVGIEGQDLVDGETTVKITVSAENGNQYAYYLYVDAEEGTGAAVTPGVQIMQPEETEAETEEPEPETEDPRYVKVDRESLEAASTTIDALKKEAGDYRDRMELLMNILYGMIAFCVILLFVVINLLLKKKDLKAELRNYRGYGYQQEASGEYEEAPSRKERKAMEKEAKREAKAAKKAAKKAPKKGQKEQEAYEAQGYDASNGYEPQGYDSSNGYSQQGYDVPNGYSQQGYDAPNGYSQQEYDAPNGYEQQDDPMSVPKPSRAKNRSRRMPEYEKTQQAYDYQPQQGNSDKNVEVTMIDL